jgi:hypothetical protein
VIQEGDLLNLFMLATQSAEVHDVLANGPEAH